MLSGTPPLKAQKMVVSPAAMAKQGRTSRCKLIASYDVSAAFFRAMSAGKIAVTPQET